MFVPSLCAGIAVGRLGCFFAGLPDRTFGVPSALPWAVNFGDGTLRHPVQLYEALFYLLTWVLLLFLANRLKVGRLSGLFFLMVFGSRFLLEFFKEPQSMVFNESSLLAGQLLSLPFIALSLYLLFRPAQAAAKPE